MGKGNGSTRTSLVPGEADRLFEIPPAQFIKARDELAKDLASKGSKQEAEIVRGLRKPTTSVWAINLAARRDPEQLQLLLASFRKLRDATSAAELREGSSDRHSALTSFVDAAAAILQAAGLSAAGPIRERITRTLLAAATDDQALVALERGQLDKDLEPRAFGLGIPFPEPIQKAGRPRDDSELRLARVRAEQLRAEADELAARAKALESAAAEAALQLELAREAAERTRVRAERARRTAADKRTAADEAAARLAELEKRFL